MTYKLQQYMRKNLKLRSDPVLVPFIIIIMNDGYEQKSAKKQNTSRKRGSS
jgi:hypothetical protein